MGDYLMNSVFAANLLDYLFQNIDYPWENPYTSILGKDCKVPQFHEDIGRAVCFIWQQNAKDFVDCCKELSKSFGSDKEAYSKCALSAADSYFSEGYSPGSFLGYCAIVLGVSTFYYAIPPNGIPEIAVEVVALALFAHQMTGQFYKNDGWDGLLKTSKLFNAVCETNCT